MGNSGTQTSFGSWENYTGDLTVEATVLWGLEGGDSDWRDRVETSGAFDAMVAEFRSAVDDQLPEGVFLSGNDFIGPYYIEERTWEGELDITEIIQSIDVNAIVDRHDPDKQPATR